ncbi:MAG: hypothetical protein ACRD12_14410, partial [Acidimicrobiales bacterium]
RLQGTALFIQLISAHYLQSPFCMCELGAQWALETDSFPLLVPPVGPKQLEGVLGNVHAHQITDAAGLDDLVDRVRVNLGIASSTAQWNRQRQQFLSDLPALLAPSEAEVEVEAAAAGGRTGVRAYGDFEAARGRIVAACKRAREVRVLANRGDAYFGSDNAVIRTDELRDYAGLEQLRFLLMDPKSPWIIEERIKARGYASADAYRQRLERIHHSLTDEMELLLATRPHIAHEMRLHQAPPAFRLVLTGEVAFASSYGDYAVHGSQIRDQPVYEFANSPGSLYSAFSIHFATLWDGGRALG